MTSRKFTDQELEAAAAFPRTGGDSSADTRLISDLARALLAARADNKKAEGMELCALRERDALQAKLDKIKMLMVDCSAAELRIRIAAILNETAHP